MTRLTLRIGVVVAGLAVVGTTARAQRRVRGGRAVLVDRPAVGPRVGYDFDVDHVFVGGQLNLPVGRRWTLVPSAEFYPGVNGSPLRLNADLKFHPPTVYGFFYLGGGFAYLHGSGASDAGANLFAGWEGRRARPFKPFLEGKFVFADRTSFNVEAGLNFPL
ncbi:MAG: hypothetical protein DMD44_02105 [Gemmatimonadetes bacterium]|nr:MAG: hypothetical protein DMD44_02105 [Gemmatimonadota bacterium]